MVSVVCRRLWYLLYVSPGVLEGKVNLYKIKLITKSMLLGWEHVPKRFCVSILNVLN